MLLAFIAGLVLPWWSIAIASFVTMLMVGQSALKSFVAGFIALFVLWGALALWIDIKNQGILSKKMALIFPLNGSSMLLVLITAIVGALVAGLAGLTAGFLRAAK